MTALHKPERATYDQAVEAQQEPTYWISCCIPFVCNGCAIEGGPYRCCK